MLIFLSFSALTNHCTRNILADAYRFYNRFQHYLRITLSLAAERHYANWQEFNKTSSEHAKCTRREVLYKPLAICKQEPTRTMWDEHSPNFLFLFIHKSVSQAKEMKSYSSRRIVNGARNHNRRNDFYDSRRSAFNFDSKYRKISLIKQRLA